IEPASDTRARVGVDTCCTPELKVLFDPNNAISAPPPIAASAPITSSRPPSTNSTTRLAMAPPPSATQTLAEQSSGTRHVPRLPKKGPYTSERHELSCQRTADPGRGISRRAAIHGRLSTYSVPDRCLCW